VIDSYKFKESNTVSERRVQRASGGFDCVHVNFITDDEGEGKRGMKDAGARYADVVFFRVHTATPCSRGTWATFIRFRIYSRDPLC